MSAPTHQPDRRLLRLALIIEIGMLAFLCAVIGFEFAQSDHVSDTLIGFTNGIVLTVVAGFVWSLAKEATA